MKILLVDKREIFREGLAKLIQSSSRMQVVGTCCSGLEAVEKADKLRPDVVLIDTELPEDDLIEAIRKIYKLLPETKVLLLAHSIKSHELLEAIRSGASGYVTKDITVEDLIKTVTLIFNGEVIIGAPVAQALFNEVAVLKATNQSRDKRLENLSEREYGVLELVAKGK